MKKIPFDIKFRPEIEAGKYKVVTEYGEPVRIICWDSKYHTDLPVIALVNDGDGEDMIHLSKDGKTVFDDEKPIKNNLILVSDELEDDLEAKSLALDERANRLAADEAAVRDLNLQLRRELIRIGVISDESPSGDGEENPQ